MIFRSRSRRQRVTRAPDADGLDVLARVVRDHDRRAQHRRRRVYLVLIGAGIIAVVIIWTAIVSAR
ncbi:MAG: hypothetical protein DRJ42_29325 [Deltaproteobacteria bacterium]|nr:MAG: hypothetical protein DRJ42_29325 [Deltaproteobacteria bacterium]